MPCYASFEKTEAGFFLKIRTTTTNVQNKEGVILQVIYLYDLNNFLYTTFIFIAFFPQEDLTFKLLILSMGALLQRLQIFFLTYITFHTYQNFTTLLFYTC